MSSRVHLDRAIIQNDSSQVIRDIKIIHAPTGVMGEVNMILPHASFELGLLQSDLKADKAAVNWLDAQGKAQSRVVSLPKRNANGGKMALIYRFLPGDSLLVQLETITE